MSIPNIPTNFYATPGSIATSGVAYLRWDAQIGATSASSAVTAPSTGAYDVLRSTDNLNFSVLTSINQNFYYDTAASTGVIYYYSVRANGNSGQSQQASALQLSVANQGQTTLGAVRLAAQQRADMINSNFVTIQEWNDYISHSYTELYDILVQVYADAYYQAPFYSFQTDGRYPGLYPLPNDVYKLLGVDLAIGTQSPGPASPNGYLTLKKFMYGERNRYVYGNVPVSFLGLLGLRYRLEGQSLEFIPQPSANQTIRLRYIPRPNTLMADSDVLDGISGWDEYVIVDAAIKAMQKEESDVTILIGQKMALMKRIEAAAANRDAGEPERVTDVRGLDGGSWESGYGDGPIGGY
jgi:hypothetical protein